MDDTARLITTVDLRALDVLPGGATRLRVSVPVADLSLGRERYRIQPAAPATELRVARSLSGVHLRLRADPVVVGPCWRCLGEARVRAAVDTSEFQADDRPPGAAFNEDLDSVYVEGGRLDLAQWLRDAIAEALPATILCAESCAGLCPSCGADLNRGRCSCSHDQADPRWAPLGELAERLARRG